MWRELILVISVLVMLWFVTRISTNTQSVRGSLKYMGSQCVHNSRKHVGDTCNVDCTPSESCSPIPVPPGRYIPQDPMYSMYYIIINNNRTYKKNSELLGGLCWLCDNLIYFSDCSHGVYDASTAVIVYDGVNYVLTT